MLVFYFNGYTDLTNILISSAYCLVASAMIVLSVIDFRTNIIPFGVNIVILVLGLCITMIMYLGSGRDNGVIFNHILGVFAVGLLLLLILLISRGRAMGGGDVKLMGAAGLVLGWKLILLAFLLGCILASVIHPIRMKLQHQGRILAFGPYLATGIIAAILFGERIIDWYLQAFILT